MCLLKKDNRMQIADKDIICYKIIEIYNMPNGKSINLSYYQGAKIVFGKPIKALVQSDIETLNSLLVLGAEVVHAFVEKEFSSITVSNLEETTTFLSKREYRSCDSIDIAVIECTIPKGTYYCEGYDSTGRPNYGALTIIPNKIIKKLATIKK